MPGRTRCAQSVPSDSNIAVVSTKRARSASSATRGSPAASSPETMSAPSSPSGARSRAGSPQAAGDAAPVRRARKEVDPSLSPRLSARASACAPPVSGRPPTRRSRRARLVEAALARRGAPRRGFRPAARAAAQAALPGWSAAIVPAGFTVMTSAPARRAARSQRSTNRGALDDRLVPEDEADLRVADRRERRAEGVDGRMEVVRQDRACLRRALLARAARSRVACSTVSPPENATTTEPPASRSPRSASSTAWS